MKREEYIDNVELVIPDGTEHVSSADLEPPYESIFILSR